MFKKIVILMLLFSMILSGCAKKDSLDCDFTDMNWENSIDDIMKYENSEYETYDSMYLGTTYTFPKEYLGKSGLIKYMTDDKDVLMNVSWLYVGDEENDVLNVYEALKNGLIQKVGEPTENTDNVNNYGEVWKLESGNIILTAVITSDGKMVQVGYMNPVVSNGNTANPKTK